MDRLSAGACEIGDSVTGEVVVALDAGGSHVKATVFDVARDVHVTRGEPVPLHAPGQGFQERDPEALWTTSVRCIRDALTALGSAPTQVRAVGLTGHGNGTYLVDDRGRPTRLAIMATDMRAAGLVREWVAAGLEDQLRPQAWNSLWAGMTGPELAWLARYEPEVLDDSFAVLGCKDYLRGRLTGRVHTEVSQATACGLYDNSILVGNPHTRALAPNEMALSAFGIHAYRRLLGETVGASEVFEVSDEGSVATGIPAGTPVVAGLVDNPAAQHGSGVFDSSVICIGAGTWSINQLLVPSSEMVSGGLLGRVRPFAAAMALGAHGLLCEASATSASTFSWALEQVLSTETRLSRGQGRDPYEERLTREARRRRREDDPLFVPFVQGSRNDSSARGAWLGLSTSTGVDELVGAVLEGICFEHRRHIDRLEGSLASHLPVRLSGGASRSPEWCQRFADNLARSVAASPISELGSVAVAAMAAVGAGTFATIEAAVAHLNPIWTTYEPDPNTVDLVEQRWKRYRRWADRLDREQWAVSAGGLP